jgi:hypothetical protein
MRHRSRTLRTLILLGGLLLLANACALLRGLLVPFDGPFH